MKKLLLLSCMLCCFLSGWAQDANEPLIQLDSIVTTVGHCVAVLDGNGNYHIAVANNDDEEEMSVYISPKDSYVFVEKKLKSQFQSWFVSNKDGKARLENGENTNQTVYVFTKPSPNSKDSLYVEARVKPEDGKVITAELKVPLIVYQKPTKPEAFVNQEIKNFNSLKDELENLFVENENADFKWRVVVTDKDGNHIAYYNNDNIEIIKNDYKEGSYSVQLEYYKEIDGNENEVNLKITYGYSFNYAPEPVVIESMSIVGDLTGGWPNDETNDWSMAKAMTKIADNDAVWTLILTDVELETKAYYYKAVANQKWGDCDLPETDKEEYVINEAGKYTLTFTANTEEHTLTLVAEKQQVIPEITKVELRGDWNWNSAEGMTEDDENTWTMILDLTDTENDQAFKLFVNDEDVFVNSSNTQFDDPEGWIYYQEDGDNWILKNSQTEYQTYKVTATWLPNENAADNWTLKFEGLDMRPNLSIDPDTLYFDAKGKSDNGIVQVTSNVEWKTKIEEEHNWISFTNKSEQEVEISVEPNTGEDKREGYVVFYIENTEIKDTVTVIQEGVGPMPKIFLTKNPNRTNVYSDTEIELSFKLLDLQSNEPLSSLDDFTWTWNGQESKDTLYKFEPTTDKHKVVLEVTRNADKKSIKDSVDFVVWPEPNVTVEADIDGNKSNVSSGAQLSCYFDQSIKLAVISKGGTDEWTYSWKEDDSEVGKDSVLTISYDANKNNPRNIALSVRNTLPDDNLEKVWNYNITITFDKRPAANITLIKNPNVSEVFNGKEIEFSFELTDNGIPVEKENFEWTWKVDGVEKATGGNTFIYTSEAIINEGSKSQNVELQLTRKSDGDTGNSSCNITVWSLPVPYANGEQLVNDATITKDLEQDETWKLNITREGGYTNDSQAWTYVWKDDNGKQDEGRNYEISYDGRDSRYVTLTITNHLPGNNGDYPTGLWKGTYKFVANFREPVKDMPRIELNGKMNGMDAPENLLTGSSVEMSFILYDQESKKEITDLSGYSWTWDGTDGKRTYIFGASNDQEDGSVSREVKFTLTRTADEKSITSTKTYSVWPKANVTPTPADRSLSSLTESNKELGFGLTTMGGYSQGWKFLWRAEGRELSDTRICNLKYEDFKDRKDTLELILLVTNQAPEYQEYWFDAEYRFFVKFTGESGIVILSSKDEFMKGEYVNVLGNDIVKLSYQASTPLTGTEWTADNNAKVDGDIITFPNVEEKSMVKVTLKSKEASDAEKIFIVWPEPQLDDISWSMKFKDTNNSSNENMPTSSVRSGNTIQLADVPSLKGGYEGKSESLVRLKGNSNSLLSNRNEWKVDGNLPFENGIYKGAIEYVAQTSFDNNELMGERVVASYPITVYQKPSTPTSLALKGNGTSGTWYVSGYDGKDGALRLYDNGVEKKIEGHANDWSWIIQDGSAQQDKANGYYVVNAKDYGKGVVITSGKRSVSGVDEEWDGSVYGSSGSVHQAPQQTVAGQYSINGVQTNEFVRGLNIIRLEDGTVRKVFKK